MNADEKRFPWLFQAGLATRCLQFQGHRVGRDFRENDPHLEERDSICLELLGANAREHSILQTDTPGLERREAGAEDHFERGLIVELGFLEVIEIRVRDATARDTA